MTKAQLIDRIAKQHEITKKQATDSVEMVLTAIQDALLTGEAVQLVGIGTISVKEKAAYTGRNPRTNETVQIPASRRVAFSASKLLKEKLNETR